MSINIAPVLIHSINTYRDYSEQTFTSMFLFKREIVLNNSKRYEPFLIIRYYQPSIGWGCFCQFSWLNETN